MDGPYMVEKVVLMLRERVMVEKEDLPVLRFHNLEPVYIT